ncbi:putative DNA-binding domain-containing protein [Hydrogenophaga pseudoflava]|uniref:Putative DNA-binding domain-containing protein n=1 Tax=Hydrogenophaga pseudoflava TaxID=47421 RepID=A0A4P6WY58_HYDPS|nr:putative DNA-binding domain-containing protein [Hydrogenophaga pseudoflava]QBM27326.1 hypothetical protein HPF_06495 [Hydrogenophaga pseudoflava]
MNARDTATLAQQQQLLLDALFARPGDGRLAADARLTALLDTRHAQSARGLVAYRSNGHAMAERALRAAYPVIAAMLGNPSFELLARDLWHTHPPRGGDLAQWGDALPGFLQANDQLSDVPYLGEVARAEWALHRAGSAADAEPDLPSFARLASEDPHGLTLSLSPGTTVIGSRFPVASLVTAHLFGDPSLAEAAQRLRDGIGEPALVWRQGLRPRIAAIDPSAAALVQALQAGADLAGALDAACAADTEPPAFDFSAWLTATVTDGLVIGVQRLTDPAPHLEMTP